jgi:septal ring factor EnvC (AmiA/AmiB activator)
MKFLLLAAHLWCAHLTVAARMTPVQQVLAMLTDMKVKGEKSITAEQKVFATYKEWVSDQSTQLGFDIETAESSISRLLAYIDLTDNKVFWLANSIAELDGEIGKLEGEKGDSTSIRDSERAEFDKVSQDLSESVDALERAIQVTKTQAYDRPQASALLQRMAKNTPAMRRVLAAFLQEQGQSNAWGARCRGLQVSIL